MSLYNDTISQKVKGKFKESKLFKSVVDSSKTFGNKDSNLNTDSSILDSRNQDTGKSTAQLKPQLKGVKKSKILKGKNTDSNKPHLKEKKKISNNTQSTKIDANMMEVENLIVLNEQIINNSNYELEKENWNEQEKDLLIKLCASRISKKWKIISQIIQTKTPTQCAYKYRKLLQNNVINFSQIKEYDLFQDKLIRERIKCIPCDQIITSSCSSKSSMKIRHRKKKKSFDEHSDKILTTRRRNKKIQNSNKFLVSLDIKDDRSDRVIKRPSQNPTEDIIPIKRTSTMSNFYELSEDLNSSSIISRLNNMNYNESDSSLNCIKDLEGKDKLEKDNDSTFEKYFFKNFNSNSSLNSYNDIVTISYSDRVKEIEHEFDNTINFNREILQDYLKEIIQLQANLHGEEKQYALNVQLKIIQNLMKSIVASS